MSDNANIQNDPPTEIGRWLVRCMETDYEWEPVILTMSERGIMVHDQHIGRTLLEHYHNGLTDVEWMRPLMSDHIRETKK